MRRQQTAGRIGFTIVEILVTIAVIGLLMGILIPAARFIRIRGHQTAEMATARQLMTGYTAYANANEDRVMPGYHRDLPARDDRGDWISSIPIRSRYPWRLQPFLSDIRALYGPTRDELERMEQIGHDEYVYFVSYAPALGLNTEFVGGNDVLGAFNPAVIGALGQFYLKTLSQARNGERVMVFGSARSTYAPINELDPSMSGEDVALDGQIVEGFFRLSAPYWTPSAGYRWAEDWRAGLAPEAYGYMSLRHGASSVIAFVDGHVGTATASDLRDMRLWCDRADRPDWLLGR